MFECKFVQIDMKSGAFERKIVQDYKNIIEEHLKDGWRLVQIFTPSFLTGPSSTPNYSEIIFEREIKD